LDDGRVISYSLSKESLTGVEIFSLPGARLLAVGVGEDVLALASESRALLLSLSSTPPTLLLKTSHVRAITCLAVHPRTPLLALGDVAGQVRLCAPERERVPQVAPWHQGPLGGLHWAG